MLAASERLIRKTADICQPSVASVLQESAPGEVPHDEPDSDRSRVERSGDPRPRGVPGDAGYVLDHRPGRAVVAAQPCTRRRAVERAGPGRLPGPSRRPAV